MHTRDTTSPILNPCAAPVEKSTNTHLRRRNHTDGRCSNRPSYKPGKMRDRAQLLCYVVYARACCRADIPLLQVRVCCGLLFHSMAPSLFLQPWWLVHRAIVYFWTLLDIFRLYSSHHWTQPPTKNYGIMPQCPHSYHPTSKVIAPLRSTDCPCAFTIKTVRPTVGCP